MTGRATEVGVERKERSDNGGPDNTWGSRTFHLSTATHIMYQHGWAFDLLGHLHSYLFIYKTVTFASWISQYTITYCSKTLLFTYPWPTNSTIQHNTWTFGIYLNLYIFKQINVSQKEDKSIYYNVRDARLRFTCSSALRFASKLYYGHKRTS